MNGQDNTLRFFSYPMQCTEVAFVLLQAMFSQTISTGENRYPAESKTRGYIFKPISSLSCLQVTRVHISHLPKKKMKTEEETRAKEESY